MRTGGESSTSGSRAHEGRRRGHAGGVKRAPLPPELGTVFPVQDAAAVGIRRSRLRANDLRAPFRGVRAAAGHPSLEAADVRDLRARERFIVARAEALATVLTETQFFTHVTAAVVWGIPLPPRLVLSSHRLDVGVFAPCRHPRREGVRGHEVAPGSAVVVPHPVTGLPVTSPASTWAMLASVLPDVDDLVVAGDRVVREPLFRGDPRAMASLDDLRGSVDVGRRVGIRQLREALPLVRTRSASPGETRCRLDLVRGGLPEPALNHVIRGVDGRQIAVADLAYPAERVAVEYEGEHHLREPAQWNRDILRQEALVALGWTVIRVTKAQLGPPMVERVRAALS